MEEEDQEDGSKYVEKLKKKLSKKKKSQNPRDTVPGQNPRDTTPGQNPRDTVSDQNPRETVLDQNPRDTVSGTPSDEVYSWEKNISGKCIIFSHRIFTCGPSERPYTQMDANDLDKFFSSRGFDVEVHPDRTAEEISDILSQVSAQTEYHKYASSFVCCVLTHGTLHNNQEYVYAKNRAYLTETLFEPFTGNKCLSLAGKPKLFFIQACRGKDYDPGVSIFYKLGMDFLSKLNLNFLPLGNKPSNLISESLVSCRIPIKADFLIAYSTVRKFVSWKTHKENTLNPEESTGGSWFIQALCETLEERADDLDLLSLLTIVCRKVAYDYESKNTKDAVADHMKQVPSIFSTLTKSVKFPLKIDDDEKFLSSSELNFA